MKMNFKLYQIKMFSTMISIVFFCSFAIAKQTHKLPPSNEEFDETAVKPPIENEVCFSPGEHCDVKLYKLIQTAQKSIDIAIYDINLDKLVHEVLLASKKIQVRIIVDRRQSKGNHSLVPLLIKAGAKVRYGKQRGIMHNKFCIVDSKILETGSFNFTNHASLANQENQIYLTNPGIVGRYKTRFEKMWDEASEK